MFGAGVSVVCQDVSSNCLGRAIVLAELAAHFADVKIVGPRRGDRVWQPALARGLSIVHERAGSYASYPRLRRWLSRQLAGTRVIVSKPLATSLGLTLAAGVRAEQLLLDVDDWEAGFFESAGNTRKLIPLLAPRSLNCYWSTLWLEQRVPRFPHRLASNRWLAARFGGAVLPHVRDTDVLDPARFPAEQARAELDMGAKTWVGFIGTIRRHKGVEDLVEALASLRDGPGLFLGGADQTDEYVRQLVSRAGARLGADRLRVLPPFDLSELPKWVSAPDIVCIASRAEAASAGQIPAKLFDAMAMAKAIVASRVNDLPEALDGCGVLVDPDSPRALAEAITALAADPGRRQQLGQLARERAVQRYSYRAGRDVLGPLLEALPAYQA